MMVVHGEKFEIKTRGENDILDISGDVAQAIANSGVRDGVACVFVSGSTGAITTIEYEPGLLEDLPVALERMMPKGIEYQHHLRWRDGNGHSHVRASLMGPSLTVPFRNRSLLLGTWQQIVFVEMDVHSRNREIHVQIIGE